MIHQRTKEWYIERHGKITTSRFGDVIAGPDTKRYRLYLTEIVSALSGAPYMESEEKPWFTPGRELEPIARQRYEFEKLLRGEEIEVQEAGFYIHPVHKFIGCSPDGVMVKNKGLEIKSSTSHPNFSKMVKCGLPSNHKPQVQGQLWVCELDSVDFVLFFRDPDGKLPDEIKIIEVFPDLEYHKFLERKCLEFWEKVEGETLQYEWIQGE